MDLSLVWAVIILFGIMMYIIMDGFDLGIGILYPFFKDKDDRDLMMNTVAPVWDGNETWLVLGGGGMTITHAGNIVLGHGFTSFAANCFAVGGDSATLSSSINLVVIGKGNTATATVGGLTIRCTNGITTANLAMGDMTLTAPLGTGSALSGSLNLQTGLTQAGGSTQHPARTGFSVKASATAADTDGLIFDVDTATLKRISVGAANSGGAGFKLLRIAN